MSTKWIVELTRFLNVDLEIGARTRAGLDLLVAEMSPRPLLLLFRGKIGAVERAHFELGRATRTVDATLRALLRALGRLSPAAMRAWKAAARRDLNIGIQAGATPASTAFAIAPETAQAIASLGGRIVFTVYAPALLSRSARRRA